MTILLFSEVEPRRHPSKSRVPASARHDDHQSRTASLTPVKNAA